MGAVVLSYYYHFLEPVDNGISVDALPRRGRAILGASMPDFVIAIARLTVVGIKTDPTEQQRACCCKWKSINMHVLKDKI